MNKDLERVQDSITAFIDSLITVKPKEYQKFYSVTVYGHGSAQIVFSTEDINRNIYSGLFMQLEYKINFYERYDQKEIDSRIDDDSNSLYLYQYIINLDPDTEEEGIPLWQVEQNSKHIKFLSDKNMTLREAVLYYNNLMSFSRY